jgi:hypothetical protein
MGVLFFSGIRFFWSIGRILGSRVRFLLQWAVICSRVSFLFVLGILNSDRVYSFHC